MKKTVPPPGSPRRSSTTSRRFPSPGSAASARNRPTPGPRFAMSAADVLGVLAALDGRGIPAWLDGGWGIDALLGEQTRPHEDVDLVVPVPDVPALVE